MNFADRSTAAIEAAMEHAAVVALSSWFEADPEEFLRVPGFLARVNCLGQVRRTNAAGVPVGDGKPVRCRPNGVVCVMAVNGIWFKVPNLMLLGLAIGRQWPDVERLTIVKRPARPKQNARSSNQHPAIRRLIADAARVQ